MDFGMVLVLAVPTTTSSILTARMAAWDVPDQIMCLPSCAVGLNVAKMLAGPYVQFYSKQLAGGLATVQHNG